MAYNIKLPNGKYIRNVPDDVPEDVAKAKAYSKFPEWGAAEPRSWGEAAVDLGASMGSGIGQIMQTPGQIRRLVSGDLTEEPGTLESAGKSVSDAFDKHKSDTLKGKEARLSTSLKDSEGFVDDVLIMGKALLTDPALLTSMVAETLPTALAGGVGGAVGKIGLKAIYKAATKTALERVGLGTAMSTNAAIQGADVGSDTHERIYKQLIEQGMDPEQANRIAVEGGRDAAVKAGMISLGSQFIPGATTVERAMLGMKNPGINNIAKAISREALSEFIEEGGGALVGNLATKEVFPETDVWQGVGAAGTGAAILGGVIGGGAQGLSGIRARRQERDAVNAQREVERAQAIEQATKIADEQAQQQAVQDKQILAGATEGSVELTDAIGVPKSHKAMRKALAEAGDLTDPTNVASIKTIIDKYLNAKRKTPLPEAVVDNLNAFLTNPVFTGETATQPTTAQPNTAQTTTQPVIGPDGIAEPTVRGKQASPDELGVSRFTATDEDIKGLGIRGKYAPAALKSADLSTPEGRALALTTLNSVLETTQSPTTAQTIQDSALYARLTEQVQNDTTQAPQPSDIQSAQDVQSDESIPMELPQEDAAQGPTQEDVQALAEQTANTDSSFPAWMRRQGISLTDANQDWRALENAWYADTTQQGTQPDTTTTNVLENSDERPTLEPTPDGRADQSGVGVADVGTNPTANEADTTRGVRESGGQGLDDAAGPVGQDVQTSQQEPTTLAPQTQPQTQPQTEPQTQPQTQPQTEPQIESQTPARQSTERKVDLNQPITEDNLEAVLQEIAFELESDGTQPPTVRVTDPANQGEADGLISGYWRRIVINGLHKGMEPMQRVLRYMAGDVYVAGMAPTPVERRQRDMAKKLLAMLPPELQTQYAAHLREIKRNHELGTLFLKVLAAHNQQGNENAAARRDEAMREYEQEYGELPLQQIQDTILADDQAADAWARTHDSGTAAYRGAMRGHTSAALAVATDRGDLRSAIEHIAADKDYSALDKLVAKRLLSNRTFPLPSVQVVPAGSLEGGAAAMYDPVTDTVSITQGNVDSHTVLHETVHGFLHVLTKQFEAGEITNAGLVDLQRVYDHVREVAPTLGNIYGMQSLSEFASEAMSNPRFQDALQQVPYRKQSAITAFGRAVLKLLGFGGSPNNALAAALLSAERSMTSGRQAQRVGMQARPRAQHPPAAVVRNMSQAQLQALGPGTLYVMAGGRSLTPTQQRTPIHAPSVTEARDHIINLLDNLETRFFSSDAKLNNVIRRELMKDTSNWAYVRDSLIQASTSQAVHSDTVASQFLERGNLVMDPDTHKFKAVDDVNNYKNLMTSLRQLAQRHGVPLDLMNGYANEAFIAARLQGLRAAGRTDVDAHRTNAQIAAGMAFFKLYPELHAVQTMWNGIRKNAMDLAVDAGLFTRKDAQGLLDVIDYVPFTRELQQEAGRGVGSSARGLVQFAKSRKLRGSEQKVNDIFDNMERWTAYMVSHAVRNNKANQLLDILQKVAPNRVQRVSRGRPAHKEENIVDLWRGGRLQRFEFDDPLFIDAFRGATEVALPAMNWGTKMANFLRHNVVLYPLFSLSQIPQDSVTAMYSSGLRHPFKLPFMVASEFVKTVRGTSDTHKEMAVFGAVGDKDPTAEIYQTGQRRGSRLHQKRFGGKPMIMLERIAMASDNAVRQAVYRMSQQQGVDKATALERAFEVINFRRRGSSARLNVMRQYVPFLNAFMQAGSVMYRTATGRGIAPIQRAEALRNFAMTSAKVAALSFAYAAMAGGSDDYEEMERGRRDRSLVLPGTSVHIPLRTDIFLFPKLAGEYAYLLLTDNAFTDGTKVRAAFGDALVNAISSPTVVPQAIKPFLEGITNYNFFTGRPIVGSGLNRQPTDEQFTSYTSELSKAIGSTGIVSPLIADHILRGTLGTTGALTMNLIDAVVRSGTDRPRPAKDTQEFFASIPGASAFLSREFGSGAKNDYYELSERVSEAVAGFNRIRKRGDSDQIESFYEDNKQLLAVKSAVANIERRLTMLRNAKQAVMDAPINQLTPQEKQERLRNISESERRLAPTIYELRKMAGM